MDRYQPLQQKMDGLRASGLERRLRLVEPTGPVTARVNGQECLLFCSNDYLGLAHHPEVVAAAQGSGAGGSRLISGHRPAHQALEDALSELFGQPATLLPTGYHANLALFSTVLPENACVASDALNHASIIDGLRLARVRRHILPHASADIPEDCSLIAVESLYSMDGDTPDLRRYPRAPYLFVDEAHAFGCLGPQGKGVAEAHGVLPDFRMATLGKALGAAGAFLVGPPILRELLISSGRPLVYTTGLPETVVRAALVALRLANDERREKLAANTLRLRRGLLQIGAQLRGDAHIIPLLTGERTMTVAQRLLSEGIYAPGIRYPTVARGEERVRLTVSAAHTEEQVDRCIAAVERALSQGRG